MNTAVMPTYGRADIAFEKGEGVYLISTDGRRFLDFGSGIAVNALGHSHPKLVQALQDQVGTLWHTSNLYHIPQQTALAELLCKTSFADLVFFGNSGAEAVEGHQARPQISECSRASRKISNYRCSGSFHGRSFATLSASKNPKHPTALDPRPADRPGAFGNLNELQRNWRGDRSNPDRTHSGRGRYCPAEIEYLKGLRQTADEFGCY